MLCVIPCDYRGFQKVGGEAGQEGKEFIRLKLEQLGPSGECYDVEATTDLENLKAIQELERGACVLVTANVYMRRTERGMFQRVWANAVTVTGTGEVVFGRPMSVA